jgi:hypothetical protein
VNEPRERHQREHRACAFATGEVEIDDFVDDERVREVLELVELGDQFPRIRQEALDGVEQPEPPPDVVQREGRMTEEEEAVFARECAAAIVARMTT